MIQKRLHRLPGRFVNGALLLIVALVGCREGKDQTPSLTPQEFSFDGQRWVIELPSGAAIRAAADDSHVRIELRPNTRYPTVIALEAMPERKPIEPFDRTERLGEARSLNYRISTASVGSGGPEAFLDGQLTLADRTYLAACHIQGDSITIGDATWCLRYLRTLKAQAK